MCLVLDTVDWPFGCWSLKHEMSISNTEAVFVKKSENINLFDVILTVHRR